MRIEIWMREGYGGQQFARRVDSVLLLLMVSRHGHQNWQSCVPGPVILIRRSSLIVAW